MRMSEHPSADTAGAPTAGAPMPVPRLPVLAPPVLKKKRSTWRRLAVPIVGTKRQGATRPFYHRTWHGADPSLVPVGTQATVKCVADQVADTGAQVVLAQPIAWATRNVVS